MKNDPLKVVRIRKRLEQAGKEQLAGNYDAAREIYDELLKVELDNASAMHGLGVLLVQKGSVEEAEQWLRHAVDAAPDEPRHWNDWGEVLRQLGRGEEAESAYRKALVLKPDFVEAMNNLGVVLAGQGETEAAKGWFMKVIHIDPEYAHPYNNLGVVLESEGLLDEALLQYEMAIKHMPSFSEAKDNYANLMIRKPELIIGSMNRMFEDAKKFT